MVTEVVATNSHNNRSCQLFGSDRTLQLNISNAKGVVIKPIIYARSDEL
jgi:hypothetical protein